ncbi:HNH endonuclease [Mycobacterium sp. PDNC021]|uniref:HNH endonuclease n=1 Tax=Mycobacterium sp. PDNC021 TaxID=3391399 RepID=UPI003AADDB3B
MNKPCLGCGRLISKGSRCAQCTPKRQRPQGHPHTNTGRWKRLSQATRKAQPWCLDCRRADRLQADHIIPIAERPDLAFEPLNLTTRCASCNGRRGDRCTDTERAQVLTAIAARKQRWTNYMDATST